MYELYHSNIHFERRNNHWIPGSGPGLIIYHGGGRISQNYEQLSTALSAAFTVYIPDRRGRGLSGKATDWLPDFENAIEKKQLKKAMAILLKGLQLLDGLNKMPLWMILILVNILSFLKKKTEGEAGTLDLLPTILPEMKMAMKLESTHERYKNIGIPVNLMAGSKSPSYFHVGIQALANVLKQPTVHILANLDHAAPEQSAHEIANNLKMFYRRD